MSRAFTGHSGGFEGGEGVLWVDGSREKGQRHGGGGNIVEISLESAEKMDKSWKMFSS